MVSLIPLALGNPSYAIIDKVGDLIDKWERPAAARTEQEVKRALKEYLQTSLPDCEVRVEYGLGPGKADIGIEKKSLGERIVVAIEIKVDLNERKDKDRLERQIREYAERCHALFVVLVGTLAEQDARLFDGLLVRQEKVHFGVASYPMSRYHRLYRKP